MTKLNILIVSNIRVTFLLNFSFCLFTSVQPDDGERKRIRVIGKGGVKYLPVEDHLPFEQSHKMNETLGISRLRLNRVNDDNAYFQTMSVFLEGLALDYDPDQRRGTS